MNMSWLFYKETSVCFSEQIFASASVEPAYSNRGHSGTLVHLAVSPLHPLQKPSKDNQLLPIESSSFIRLLPSCIIPRTPSETNVQYIGIDKISNTSTIDAAKKGHQSRKSLKVRDKPTVPLLVYPRLSS